MTQQDHVRGGETGIILVNVLVTLALGAALVTLMLTAQDAELDRARRMAAMTQAEAIALGAEASVVVALRRDMIDAPDTDHLAEPWAQVAQEQVALGPGLFSVRLHDMHARLDLNGIAGGGLAAQQALLRLVAILGLPPDTTTTLMGALAQRGPLTGLDQIAGLSDDARVMLAPYVTFLETGGGVNLNTAGPEVMTAMIGSATPVSRLIAVRKRAGFLTRGDLTDAGVVAVAGAGLTSDVWEAEITVEVDGVFLTLTSRVVRLREVGRIDVVVVSRRFGARSPDDVTLPPPDRNASTN